MTTRQRSYLFTGLAISAGLLASPTFANDAAKRVIQDLYQAHQPWAGKELALDDRSVLSRFFTEELTELFLRNAKIEKACPEGDMCGIDFDPIIAAQDYDNDLKFELRVEAQPLPQAHSYAARFKLFKDATEEQVVVFTLTESKAGWRIADIAYPQLDDVTLQDHLRAIE